MTNPTPLDTAVAKLSNLTSKAIYLTPDEVEAVWLCIPWTQAELDRARERAKELRELFEDRQP